MDDTTSAERIAFTALRCLAAGLAFYATQKHPYSFYALSRWVIFGVCVYGIYLCRSRFWMSFGPAFVAIGILFNPVLPVRFHRADWYWLDIAAGALLVLSLAFRPARIIP